MRLKERETVTVQIAPRVCVKGPLGSVTADFGERTAVRASVLPADRPFSAGGSGLASGEGIAVIIPKDIPVSEGDGLFLDGKSYEIRSVRRWRAHAELECAKIN